MSRLFKRRRSSGFRTSDLFRLVAMIGMLCIILMTAMQMRESSMWRWVVRRWEVSNGAEADESVRQSNIERQQLAANGIGASATDHFPGQIVRMKDGYCRCHCWPRLFSWFA